MQQVGTWLSLVERTLGVGEVASSNLVVPTIYFPDLFLIKVRMGTDVETRSCASRKPLVLATGEPVR